MSRPSRLLAEGSYQSPDLAHTCVGPFAGEHTLDAPLFNANPSSKVLDSREEAALLITSWSSSSGRVGLVLSLDSEVLFCHPAYSLFHICV